MCVVVLYVCGLCVWCVCVVVMCVGCVRVWCVLIVDYMCGVCGCCCDVGVVAYDKQHPEGLAYPQVGNHVYTHTICLDTSHT